MQFVKVLSRISFLFFFCFIGLFACAQTETELTKYQNDRYQFNFSYPGQYVLAIIDDDEWIIRNKEFSWAVGFKIIHLQGRSFGNYINSLSAELYSTLATAYGLSVTSAGTPEKNPYANYQMGGFEFGLYISGSLGSGEGLEQLANGRNLYLNVFKKINQPGFVPDGILIYDFRSSIDVDAHKLTKEVINSFTKTAVFKEIIFTKPTVTPVDKKKPVVSKPSKPTGNPSTQATFKNVKIGKQIWMVKNLDVSTYRNGDPIPNITDNTAWSKLTTGAWCYYKNDSATYAATYGKLYNWYAVNDPRGLAPAGWHVPSDDEWTNLENYLNVEVVGYKMKEKGIFHWEAPNPRATNSSGFTGLPGGSRHIDGTFDYIGIQGNWWSSMNETNTSGGAYRYKLSSSIGYEGFLERDLHVLRLGYSVRCVKN